MKKTLKYITFLCFAFILLFSFKDIVYADDDMSCAQYGMHCLDPATGKKLKGGHASNGEICKEDDRGYCVVDFGYIHGEAGYQTTCEDYENNSTSCPNGGYAENGDKCIFDTTCHKDASVPPNSNPDPNKKEGKTCFDFSFYSETCREQDEWGNRCISVEVPGTGTSVCRQCTDDGSGNCVPVDKLTCSDYKSNDELCTTDELGNDCTFDSTTNRCKTATDYKSKVCGDYSESDCPVNGRKDDLGDTCQIKDGKCVILDNSSYTNANETLDRYGKTYEDSHNDSKYNRDSMDILDGDVTVACSDVKFLTGAWLLIRIASPFLVILFGSLDFFKAMIASDEKKMKEARGKFPKRIIAFFLLIILPFVVQFIFGNIGTYGSQNMCLVSCIVTNNTSDDICSSSSGSTGTQTGDDEPFTPPKGRTEVDKCEGLSQIQCDNSITPTHKCHWTGQEYGCQPVEQRDTYKTDCQDFKSYNSCEAGMTATNKCHWQGAQFGCQPGEPR